MHLKIPAASGLLDNRCTRQQLSAAGLEMLQQVANVDCSYNLTPEELYAKVALSDALIVRSATKVRLLLFIETVVIELSPDTQRYRVEPRYSTVCAGLQVTRQVFEASKGRLKVVGRAGVGVDNVDLAAATEVRPLRLQQCRGSTLGCQCGSSTVQRPRFDKLYA